MASSRSRSVMIPGYEPMAGSTRSAAPTFRSDIRRAASRRVDSGATVSRSVLMISRTFMLSLSRIGACSRSYPEYHLQNHSQLRSKRASCHRSGGVGATICRCPAATGEGLYPTFGRWLDRSAQSAVGYLCVSLPVYCRDERSQSLGESTYRDFSTGTRFRDSTANFRDALSGRRGKFLNLSVFWNKAASLIK